MASTSETGHGKNVANFEGLIAFASSYGTKYNPTQAIIAITALNTLHTNAKNALGVVTTKEAAWTAAINARQLAYEPIDKLATRLINALDAVGETDKIVDDARTLVRKIHGKRKSKKIENPSPEDPKQISASQQSYDSTLENFKKLVKLLGQEPLYNPNETALQIAALNAIIAGLEAKNTAVITATTPLSNARVARNHVLYDKNTGLVDVALETKKYIKSVFGAASSEYGQVKGIEFTRPKKK